MISPVMHPTKLFPSILLALFALTFAAPAANGPVLDGRFNRADVNNDLLLAPAEFLGLQTRLARWTDAIHRFNQADANDDGFLSQLEFRASNGGKSGGRPTRAQTFLLADIDLDSSLDAEEYARTLPQSRVWRSILLEFGRRDRDDDSQISREEFGLFGVPAT